MIAYWQVQTRMKIDEVVSSIKKTGLNITIEGDLQDFLGINI